MTSRRARTFSRHFFIILTSTLVLDSRLFPLSSPTLLPPAKKINSVAPNFYLTQLPHTVCKRAKTLKQSEMKLQVKMFAIIVQVADLTTTDKDQS